MCLVRSAPLYINGPKIATLVTQFGLGKPYEENGLAQKIVRNCGQESFVRRLRHDISDNRLIHFNKVLKTLSDSLKNNAYPDTNKVILPIVIGCSGVAGIMKSSRSLPRISHILEYIAILQLENNTFMLLAGLSAKGVPIKLNYSLKN